MHGLDVPYETGSGSSQIEKHQRQNLYQLMEKLDSFYRHALQADNAGHAREYLNRRGLSQEIISRFAIGYAPPDGTTSSNALPAVRMIVSSCWMPAC